MNGWKTYLCAAAAVVVLGCKAAGQSGIIPFFAAIPDSVYDFILTLLGFGGLAALRQAVANANPFDGPELPRQQ
jgi:hypothetical protein